MAAWRLLRPRASRRCAKLPGCRREVVGVTSSTIGLAWRSASSHRRKRGRAVGSHARRRTRALRASRHSRERSLARRTSARHLRSVEDAGSSEEDVGIDQHHRRRREMRAAHDGARAPRRLRMRESPRTPQKCSPARRGGTVLELVDRRRPHKPACPDARSPGPAAARPRRAATARPSPRRRSTSLHASTWSSG